MSLILTENQLQFDGFDEGGGEMYKYQNAPFTGIMIEYFPNGNTASEEEFLNGHKGGVQRRYFSNNQIEEEFHIQFNRLEGVFKRWDVNGILKRETIWQNGVCIQDSGLL
jgi:antitoxin component YwqK of YwqJK toxin-antitoxin module